MEHGTRANVVCKLLALASIAVSCISIDDRKSVEQGSIAAGAGGMASGGSPAGGSPGTGGGGDHSGGTQATGGTAGNSGTGAQNGGAAGAASGGSPAAGASGTAGAATGGTSGSAGTASGGTSGSAGVSGGGSGGSSVVSDDFVSDVLITVHEDVHTILIVTWTQALAADSTWLEFSFEPYNVMQSHPAPGATGPHREVVLGVPANTQVTLRIVSRNDGIDYSSSEYQGTTEALPGAMPVPTLLHYANDLASPERWVLGSVEDSAGACSTMDCYFHATFWLYVMDRQGRIVWYYADPASNATSSFPRLARDGGYIWIDKRPVSGVAPAVLKTTLDLEYQVEIAVPGMGECIDVTDSGALLYVTGGSNPELQEMEPDQSVRSIWNCETSFGPTFACLPNTLNWNPADDTVLISFPAEGTVVQIDRQTGALIAQYGKRAGSYLFSPSSWTFESPQFASVTPDGTLLVSSHMPGYTMDDQPVTGGHAFMEFVIDRQGQALTPQWIYTNAPEWPMFKGMAVRLANGNTLVNYGTGGVIREINIPYQTAFHVKFDVPTGNDFFNKMLGNTMLIDDLYDLNSGPD